MEANKVEQLILDNLQWKIDGINSLQYAIEENQAINSRVRKITVQLNPVQHGLVGGMVVRTAKESELLPDDPPEDAHDSVVTDKPVQIETEKEEETDELEVLENPPDAILEKNELEKSVTL